MFRRFDVLAARNLLHLQARLTNLETQLKSYDGEDRKVIRESSYVSGDGELKPSGLAWDILLAAKHWKSFERRAIGGNGTGVASGVDERQRSRMETVLEIEKVLKRYGKHSSNSKSHVET